MNGNMERNGLAATLDTASLGQLSSGELWRLGWRIVRALVQRCGSHLQVWRARARDRRMMQYLSERDLRDIGLTRSQARAEMLKPFWRS